MAHTTDGRLESIVLLFAEKVVLAAVVPSLTLLAVNPMKFDSHQQVSAAIAVIAIGYFVAHTLERKSETQPNPAPAEGLQFPGFREDIKSVSLSIGGIHTRVPIEGLRDKTFKGAAFSISGQAVTPYMEGNHIYVDVSLYGGPGIPAVQVKKGIVTVGIPGWDRNSNESAFEVVNERGIPVFQMVYMTPSDISIRGILVFPGGWVIAANETGSMINPKDPFAFAPKPIFKYPSRLHRGESVK